MVKKLEERERLHPENIKEYGEGGEEQLFFRDDADDDDDKR